MKLNVHSGRGACVVRTRIRRLPARTNSDTLNRLSQLHPKSKGAPMIKELCKDTAILSTRCEKATAADADLAQDLVDTLQTLDDAACLAAN